MEDIKPEIIKITVVYRIGDRVYIIHDPEQNKGLITALYVTKTTVKYEVSIGKDVSLCEDFEISTEKTFS